MRRVNHGPVMEACEAGSVPAAVHSALCMQMLSLTAFKTLGAHARIQAFRRLRARFFERASRAGRWATASEYRPGCTAHQKLA